MKMLTTLLTICLTALGTTLTAANQCNVVCEEPCYPCESYPCDPCNPCAPVAGTCCAMSYLPLAVGVVAVGAIAAIIITTSGGSRSQHSHSFVGQ